VDNNFFGSHCRKRPTGLRLLPNLIQPKNLYDLKTRYFFPHNVGAKRPRFLWSQKPGGTKNGEGGRLLPSPFWAGWNEGCRPFWIFFFGHPAPQIGVTIVTDGIIIKKRVAPEKKGPHTASHARLTPAGVGSGEDLGEAKIPDADHRGVDVVGGAQEVVGTRLLRRDCADNTHPTTSHTATLRLRRPKSKEKIEEQKTFWNQDWEFIQTRK